MKRGRARARRRAILLLVLALGAGTSSPARPQGSEGTGEPPVPPASGFVNDHAGILDETARARLEAFLDQLQKKTGAEFAILTVRSTAPLTPSEYKVQVFQRWGLGKRGQDDGLLMLVALEERQVRFETGYGLEGILPDVLQTNIFRERIAPRFRAGDYAGGITAGVLACAERIAREKGVTLEWDGRELRYDERRGAAGGWRLGMALLVFFVLIVLLSALGAGRAVRRSRRRRGWGPGGWGGWGGGFGGGWGGGFSGGGGSFGGGGGGFGGGSFGGFGGGASGGGGGGGKW